MSTPACLVDGCRAIPPDDAPIALCVDHLSAVADWSHREFGETDLLPSPCRACGSRLGVRWPSGWLCAVCEWRHGELVDADLPAVRVDVVYYLRFADRVKIGTSAQPRQRLAAIRHDEVLAFERGDRMLERRRHEQFESERLERTEWFLLSPRLAEHIDALGAGGDPWELYARWRSELLALRG